MFPNPLDHQELHFKHIPFPVELRVYDAQGKLVLFRNAQIHQTVTLDVSSGLYTVELSGKGHVLHTKLAVH